MISVITVTFNAASTLKETLDSIVSQNYEDYEIVAVDGGSTDGTLEVFRQYSKHIGALVSEPDKGVYDAMNKAIRLAKGDILFFLNAQDCLYSSDVLEKVNTAFMSPEKPYIVFGDIYFSNRNNIPADQLMIPSGITRSYQNNGFNDPGICHQCIFYKKELFEKLGGYDLNFQIYADFDFNIRAFTYAFHRYKYIPTTIASFDLGGISTLKNSKRLQRMHQENMQLRQKLEKEKRRAVLKHFLFSRGRDICDGGYFVQILGVRVDWTELKRRFALLPRCFPFCYSMIDGYPQDLQLLDFECPVNGVGWAKNTKPAVIFNQGKDKLPARIQIFCEIAVVFSQPMKNVEVSMILNKKKIDYKVFSVANVAEYRDQRFSMEIPSEDLRRGYNRLSFAVHAENADINLENVHLGIQKLGIDFVAPPYEVHDGEKLCFLPGHNGESVLYKRFYPPEDWGMWVPPDAVFRFRLAEELSNQDIQIKLLLNTIFTQEEKTRKIQLFAGDNFVDTQMIFSHDKLPVELSYVVPATLISEDRILEIKLLADHYLIPSIENAENLDCRKLGVGLNSMMINRLSDKQMGNSQ